VRTRVSLIPFAELKNDTEVADINRSYDVSAELGIVARTRASNDGRTAHYEKESTVKEVDSESALFSNLIVSSFCSVLIAHYRSSLSCHLESQRWRGLK
jgi:hypothetical protein